MELFDTLYIIRKDFDIKKDGNEDNFVLTKLYEKLKNEVEYLRSETNLLNGECSTVRIVEKLKIMSFIQSYILKQDLKIRVKGINKCINLETSKEEVNPPNLIITKNKKLRVRICPP